MRTEIYGILATGEHHAATLPTLYPLTAAAAGGGVSGGGGGGDGGGGSVGGGGGGGGGGDGAAAAPPAFAATSSATFFNAPDGGGGDGIVSTSTTTPGRSILPSTYTAGGTPGGILSGATGSSGTPGGIASATVRAGDPASGVGAPGGILSAAALEAGDSVIGTLLDDGWWVKAKTVDGEGEGGGGEMDGQIPMGRAVPGARIPAGGTPSRYLCCRGAGRRVEYSYRCGMHRKPTRSVHRPHQRRGRLRKRTHTDRG